MSRGDEDLRVRRTRALLKQALIDLCEEQGFASVSVGKLSERAMVNRVTFYRHFRDKYDLARAVFSDALEDMQKAMGPPRQTFTPLSKAKPPLPYSRFFEHIAAHSRLYSAMMGSNGDPWFVAQVREHLGVMLERRFLAHEGLDLAFPRAKSAGMSRKVTLGILAASVVGMITWWLDEGTKFTAEQMAQWARLVMTGELVSELQNRGTATS